MRFGATILGVGSVLKELESIKRLGDASVMLPAARAAAEVFRAGWASRMRRKSGKTADSIHVFDGLRIAGQQAEVKVGPSSARAHIARFLEDGYLRRNQRTRQVSHVPAFPTMSQTAEQDVDKVAQKFEEELFRRGGLS